MKMMLVKALIVGECSEDNVPEPDATWNEFKGVLQSEGIFLARGIPIPWVSIGESEDDEWNTQCRVPPDIEIPEGSEIKIFSPYSGGPWGARFGFVGQVERLEILGTDRDPGSSPYPTEANNIEAMFDLPDDMIDIHSEWGGVPHAWELLPGHQLWLLISIACD
jgi:hypothetical protein